MRRGTVYLVGAGPGDPGLLTRRGAELLGRADVVVYDALVNPELLKLAPATAEMIYGGKRSKRHALLQGELNELLVKKAREGKTVVRLKGGDPYTFGRGGEEGQQLAEAGVVFEIVPGISSVVAALNYAGIPLTHREFCSSFTVITGHQDPELEETGIDWEQLARAQGTRVVLMGLKTFARSCGNWSSTDWRSPHRWPWCGGERCRGNRPSRAPPRPSRTRFNAQDLARPP
jgi:uroporphyrinogen III methyltransferase / synthase